MHGISDGVPARVQGSVQAAVGWTGRGSRFIVCNLNLQYVMPTIPSTKSYRSQCETRIPCHHGHISARFLAAAASCTLCCIANSADPCRLLSTVHCFYFASKESQAGLSFAMLAFSSKRYVDNPAGLGNVSTKSTPMNLCQCNRCASALKYVHPAHLAPYDADVLAGALLHWDKQLLLHLLLLPQSPSIKAPIEVAAALLSATS